MPTLTVAGHSVTVGDEFLKLSPEEQNTTVDEIAKSLPAEKPSGFGAGLAHGVSDLASGISSTLGIGGVKSDGLDALAAKTAPENYKAAPLIREGGHFYNPADWNPGNIPQWAAEQAPGLATDLVAGKAGAMAGKAVGGVRGAAIGGIGAGLGSMALRTFGQGAHENAAARTGDANAPVSGGDMVREGVKQGLTAVPNAIGLNRLIPGLGSKAAGVGLEGAGNALKKYLATFGTEAAAGGSRNAIGQAVTNVGQEHGVPFDPNQTAEAFVGSGVLGGAMVAPRLSGDVASASKFRKFGGDNSEAATALANRQLEAADGKNLVGPLGGTKTAAEAVNAAHEAVHTELADASKNENLSTDNANTLKRINGGGTVSKGAIDALATEASPDTVHLARQAILSKQLKDMGEITDKKFTGGISGVMEDKLRALYNPTAAVASMGAAAMGLPAMIGLSPHIVAGTYGAYAAARALDKLTGARSPAQGFTDKFGDPNAPIRTQEPQAAPAAPVTTSVPQVTPPQNTQLWGSPAEPVPQLRPTLNANAKVEEGMAKIAGKIQAQKRKDTIAAATPMLRQLAGKITPAPEVTDAPASPQIAQAMQTVASHAAPPAAPAAPAPAPDAPPVQAPPIKSMADILARVNGAPQTPEAPQAPMLPKIIKKLNGSVNEIPHPEEDQPYTPKDDADLWRKHLSEGLSPEAGDQAVAARALADYQPAAREKYSKTLIENRSGHRNDLESISHENPADGAALEGLYHRLDDISTAAEANKAIKHYTAFMSPKAAHAVHVKYNHKVMAKRWKN